MLVAQVPQELQKPVHPYPPHVRTTNLEMVCHKAVEGKQVRSDAVYLPIYWTNNYYWQPCEYKVVPEVQRYLDGLDERDCYVTVVQNDEGIYERLPPNTIVLGAGGEGDIPIPLVCERHPVTARPRDLLASFAGQIFCGGGGTCSREEMVVAYGKHPECLVEQQCSCNTSRFRELMERSEFSLCPRGYGKTSFRLYEAMQFGAVPVYISDEFWLPYRDELDWGTFSMLLRPHELIYVDPDRAWADGARKRLAPLVDSHFSLEGLYARIPEMIERATA